VIIVLVVAGALVGARAWLRSRAFLELGNSSRVPAGSHREPLDTPSADGPNEVAVLPYRDGARVVYGLSIRNDGPLSVKVIEVERPEPPDASVFMFRPVAVRMADREGVRTATNAPFRPFTLKKGHQRYVEVIGQLGDCEHYAPGSSEFLDVQPVTFKVLGQTLTDNIELPARIEYRYGPGTRCPRPRAR
jgi:hypothetical protein